MKCILKLNKMNIVHLNELVPVHSNICLKQLL